MKKIKKAIAWFFWKRRRMMAIVSFAGLFFPLFTKAVTKWRNELPEYKIFGAQKILEYYPSFSETSGYRLGLTLIEEAKITLETGRLEAWMKLFKQYVQEIKKLEALLQGQIQKQIRSRSIPEIYRLRVEIRDLGQKLKLV